MHGPRIEPSAVLFGSGTRFVDLCEKVVRICFLVGATYCARSFVWSAEIEATRELLRGLGAPAGAPWTVPELNLPPCFSGPQRDPWSAVQKWPAHAEIEATRYLVRGLGAPAGAPWAVLGLNLPPCFSGPERDLWNSAQKWSAFVSWDDPHMPQEILAGTSKLKLPASFCVV